MKEKARIETEHAMPACLPAYPTLTQSFLRLLRPQRQPAPLPARDGDLVVHQDESEEARALRLEAKGPQLDGLDDELELALERAGEGADDLHDGIVELP